MSERGSGTPNPYDALELEAESTRDAVMEAVREAAEAASPSARSRWEAVLVELERSEVAHAVMLLTSRSGGRRHRIDALLGALTEGAAEGPAPEPPGSGEAHEGMPPDERARQIAELVDLPDPDHHQVFYGGINEDGDA